MNSIARTKNTFSTFIAVAVLAAGFLLSGLPARAQDQPAQSDDAAARAPARTSRIQRIKTMLRPRRQQQRRSESKRQSESEQ